MNCTNGTGVRSCYDEGKRTAETLAMDYHRGANVEVRIARIFNTYGPRMCIDDGRVVSNFVAQVTTCFFFFRYDMYLSEGLRN